MALTVNINLGLEPGERQQLFLDYLNAALRTRIQGYSGQAGPDGNGGFFSEVSGKFSVGQDSYDLRWRLEKDAYGSLQRLVISPTPETAGAGWTTAAHEFASSVLVATLAERRTTFFRRTFFYYVGAQLDGEYWLPGYRFAPAVPDDDQPFLLNAERVISIDQNIQAVDAMHAHAVAEESARRHAARLSLLMNVGLYGPEHTMRWVLLPQGEGFAAQSVRCHLTFSHPGTTLTAMPEKGAVCGPGLYKGSLAARYRVAGEHLSLPREARKILKGIALAHPMILDAFDRASRLYHVATVCGQDFPSVGLAYRVAAVEAMSAADSDCNGFSEFMRKHITSRGNLDEILRYLYGNARSGHFHGGSFPMGEFSRGSYFDPLMDVERIERDDLHRECYALTREAIVNWMQSVVPTPPADPQPYSEGSLPIHD